MRLPKSTFTFVLIAYICSFLAFGPLVGSLSAKITPKKTDEEVGIITIEKGDTLWDLAIKYYKDPFLWEEFKKYNKFTDPDLIFPGEKMQIPEKITLPTGIAKQMENEMIATMGATKAELQKIADKYDKMIDKFASTSEDVNNIKNEIARLRSENQNLKDQLKQGENQLNQLLSKVEEQGAQNKEIQERIQGLEALLTSQQTARQSVQEKIEKLEKNLTERTKLIETREGELAQLSKEIKEHTSKLSSTQENIAKLHKKIQEVEDMSTTGDAEKPEDEKESKLAVLTAIAGGVALFIVGVLAR